MTPQDKEGDTADLTNVRALKMEAENYTTDMKFVNSRMVEVEKHRTFKSWQQFGDES
jgi:hypothetical protein